MLECLLHEQETGVQIPVGSYQRLKKRYSMPLCLTLSIKRRIEGKLFPGIGIVVAPTLTIISIVRGAFGSPQTAVDLITYHV